MMSKTKIAERVHEVNGEEAPPSEWLTCMEATLFCNVSLGTFRARIMPKVLCKRLGWRIMVQRKSLEKYFDSLQQHEAEGKPYVRPPPPGMRTHPPQRAKKKPPRRG